MHVAAQHHRVGHPIFLQGTSQARARGAVAVPAIVPQHLAGTGPKITLPQQALLSQHIPLPARLAELGIKPALLIHAQQATGWITPFGAGRRVERGRALFAARGANLRVLVLARIEHVERRQLAVAHPAVNAHLGPRRQPGHGLREHGSANRHVFIKSLVSGGAARGEVKVGRTAPPFLAAGIVVLHLVVVPCQQPWARLVHRLQIGIAFVKGVALPVVFQRQQPAASGWPNRGFAVRVFVDVVAEKKHQVRVFSQHVAVGTEVAMLPVLARSVSQTHARHQRIERRKGPRAASGADGIAHHEAVKIPAVWQQTLHLHMHGMRQLRLRLRLPALHLARELLVMRDFPPHRHGLALPGRAGEFGHHEPGPQHHRVGRR